MSQYGVRMYSTEFQRMTWDEFSSLLRGLNADTPLGNLVQIRSETNPEILKNFSSSQQKIRNEWLKEHQKINTNADDHKKFLTEIQNFFAGGG